MAASDTLNNSLYSNYADPSANMNAAGEKLQQLTGVNQNQSPTNPTNPAFSANLLSQINPRKIAIAMSSGELAGLNDIERDFATKSVAENSLKYGDAAYAVQQQVMSQAGNDYAVDQSGRSALEVAGDTLGGITNGAVQGLVTAADFVATKNPLIWVGDKLTDNRLSNAIHSASSGISNASQSLKDAVTSDKLHYQSEVFNTKEQLSEAENLAQRDRDIANGDNSILANLRAIARGAVNSIKNASSTSGMMGDLAAEGGGSFLTFAPQAKLLGALGKAGAKLANLSEKGIAKAERLMSNPMTVVGVQNGGSGGLDTFNDVSQMSNEDLYQSSQMFRDLVNRNLADGLTKEDAEASARRAVTESAVSRSQNYNALTGISGLPLKWANKVKPFAVFDRNLGGAVAEASEETVEGLGQLGSNLAARQTYNNNQDLVEGVGQQMGQGALGAGLSVGAARIPFVAGHYLKSGLSGAYNTAADKISEKHDEHLVAKNLETLNAGISSLNTAANNSNDQAVKDTIQNISAGASNGFALNEDEVADWSKDFGDSIKAGDSKFTILRNTAAALNSVLKKKDLTPEELNASWDDCQTLASYVDKTFGDSANIAETISKIKDDGERAKAVEAYAAYKTFANNKAFTNLRTKMNQEADKAIDSIKVHTDEEGNTVADDQPEVDLNDEEAVKAHTVNSEFLDKASRFKVNSNTASADQLKKIKARVEQKIANDTATEDDVSFLNEVDLKLQQQQDLQNAINADQDPNDPVNQLAENFVRGKSVGDVSKQKFLTKYIAEITHRKSLASVTSEIKEALSQGDIQTARQSFFDYLNFTQSQVNKENAFRDSRAEADAINATKGKNYKDFVKYANHEYGSYNPDDRVFYPAYLHGGSIELGHIIASENERLVQNVALLRDLVFPNSANDPSLQIKNYHPDEGVWNHAQIRTAYVDFARKHGIAVDDNGNPVASTAPSGSGTSPAENSPINYEELGTKAEAIRARSVSIAQETEKTMVDPNLSVNQKKTWVNGRLAWVNNKIKEIQDALNKAPEGTHKEVLKGSLMEMVNLRDYNNFALSCLNGSDNWAPQFNPRYQAPKDPNAGTQPPQGSGTPGSNQGLHVVPGTPVSGSETGSPENQQQRLVDQVKRLNDYIKNARGIVYAKYGSTEGKLFSLSQIKDALNYENQALPSDAVTNSLTELNKLIEFVKSNGSATEGEKPKAVTKPLTPTLKSWLTKLKKSASKIDGLRSNQQEDLFTDFSTQALLEQNEQMIKKATEDYNSASNPDDKAIAKFKLDNLNALKKYIEEFNSFNEKNDSATEPKEWTPHFEPAATVLTVEPSIEDTLTALGLGENPDKGESAPKNRLEASRRKVMNLSRVKSYKDTIEELRTKSEKSPELKKVLLALNIADSNSPYTKFKQNLSQTLFYSKNNVNGLATASGLKITLDNDSILKKYATTYDRTGKINFSEALKAIAYDLDNISDSELDELTRLFPVLSMMNSVSYDKSKNTPVIEWDDGIVSNIFMNTISMFNSFSKGTGLDWERVSELINKPLAQIKALPDKEGYKFLTAATMGIMQGPLIDQLSANIAKSMKIHADKQTSLTSAQLMPKILALYTIKSMVNAGMLYKQSFTVGSPITVYSVNDNFFKAMQDNTAHPKIPEIFNTYADTESLDNILKNGNEDLSGDFFEEGKEDESKNTLAHSTYENTNINYTEQAKKALKSIQKCAYKFDETILAIYEALGLQGLIDIYGTTIKNPEYMDQADLMSKEGQNREISAAYEQLQTWLTKARAYAKEHNIPLSQVRKHFKYGLTSVNRLQELESFGPIANKLNREVLLATWNKINITGRHDTGARAELGKAIIQNFGGKLNKYNAKNTVEAFAELSDEIINSMPQDKNSSTSSKYKNLLALATDPKNINKQTILGAHAELASFMENNTAFQKIGLDAVDQNFMGLHAMVTLAQYCVAKHSGKRDLNVSIYCEADGTTNGTINSQFLLSSNIDNEDAIYKMFRLLRAGNIRPGDKSGISAGSDKEGLSPEQQDAYGMSGDAAKQKIQENFEKLQEKVENPSEDDSKYPKYPPHDGGWDNVPENKQVQTYLGAVRALFRLSGQTKSIDTYLEDFISRNFMKKPCTKAMYLAGLSSIVATFTDSILNDMHSKKTAILQKFANLSDAEKRNMSQEDIIKLSWRAAFEGMKGTKEWSDEDFIKAGNTYLASLNYINSAVLSNYSKNISVRTRFTSGTDKNSYWQQGQNASGRRVIKPFTLQSFLDNQTSNKGFQPYASLDLNQDEVDNLSNAIKVVYGKPIFDGIIETIRGSNVTDSQEAIRNSSELMYALANAIKLFKISKSNPDTESEVDINNALGRNSDVNNPLSSIVDMGNNYLALCKTSPQEANGIFGQMLNGYTRWGNYNRESFLGEASYAWDFGEYTFSPVFQLFEDPRVGVMANMTIANGDGNMMLTFMLECLQEINYATTLIFDGGNAAVGMQEKFAQLINKAQFDTDVANVVTPILAKMAALNAYMQTEEGQKVVKDTSDMLSRCVNFYATGTDRDGNSVNNFADKTLPANAGIDTLIKINQLFKLASGAPSITVGLPTWKFAEHLNEEFKGADKYSQRVFKGDDFDPNNFSVAAVRAKIADAARVKGTLGLTATERKNLPDVTHGLPFEVWNKPTAKVPVTVQNKIKQVFPTKESYVNYMVKKLEEVISYELGEATVDSEGKPDIQYKPYSSDGKVISAEEVANMFGTIVNGSVESLTTQAQNVSFSQITRYAMGVTADHMASHDNPYVLVPTKEQFNEILKKLSLNFGEGKDTVDDDTWAKVVEAREALYAKFEDIRAGENEDPTEDISERKLVSVELETNAQVKTFTEILDILKDAGLTYVKPEIKPIKTLLNQNAKYGNYTEESVTHYLKTVGSKEANQVLNRIKAFTDKFGSKYVGGHTNIVTIHVNAKVPNSRAVAMQTLREKYISDCSKHKTKPANSVLQLMTNALAVGAPVNFYSPVTDTIYHLNANPTGVVSKATERENEMIRLPHEIMHALSVKALNYYVDKLPAYISSPELGSWTEKDKISFRAVQRLKALKEEFDSFIQDSTLNKWIDKEQDKAWKEANPVTALKLQTYAKNYKRPNTAGYDALYELKEFVATFGSLTDSEAKSITAHMSTKNGVSDSLANLARDTKKDAALLSKLLAAIKNVLMDFISNTLGLRKNDATVTAIINSNLAILDTLQNHELTSGTELEPKKAKRSKKNKDTTNAEVTEKVNSTMDTQADSVSLLNETESSNDDSSVTVEPETGNAVFNANASPRTHVITEIANNLRKVIKEKFSDIDTDNLTKSEVQGNKNDIVITNLNRTVELENIKTMFDNSINKYVVPLKNLGLNTGTSDKDFAVTVNALSMVKTLKPSVYGDIAIAVSDVMEKLAPEDFVDDVTDPNQMQNGLNIISTLQGVNGVFEKSELAPVVFALSQTDPRFRKALSKLKNTKGKNKDDYLLFDKYFSKLGDKLISKWDSWNNQAKGKNYAEQLDMLAARLLKEDKNLIKKSKIECLIDSANDFVARACIKPLPGSIQKDVNGAVGIAANSVENAINRNKHMPNAFKDVAHDLKSRDRWDHELQSKMNIARVTVQQMRQSARKDVPEGLKLRFKKKLSDKTWSRFTRTIGKSDLASLFEGSTSDLAQLLADPEEQMNRIDECKAILHDKYRDQKCQQLADYMMTGKAGKFLLRNPVAIACKIKPGIEADTSVSDKEIAACDKLATLYAIQQLTVAERKELIDLLNNESDAMGILLNTAKGQSEEGRAKAKESAKALYNWYKGSLPVSYTNECRLHIAPLSKQLELSHKGYELIRPYAGTNREHSGLGIYVIKYNINNYLNQGGIQYAATTACGVKASTGESLKPHAGMITSKEEVDDITYTLDDVSYSAKNNEDLIPVFDENGMVVAYERALDPKLLENNAYISPETDYAKLIGIDQGRLKEEARVRSFNEGIVDNLFDRYSMAINKTAPAGSAINNLKEEDFVNLFKSKDPVIANIVKIMPKDLKYYIEDKFGKDKFMVQRSEINDVIGYHSASITDAWTGETRWSPRTQAVMQEVAEMLLGKKAFMYLKKFENMERLTINTAKNNIIIKSIQVPLSNSFANTVQLINEGVPVGAIKKYGAEVLREIRQYVKIQQDMFILDQEIQTLPDGYKKNGLIARRDILNDAIDKMSIAYLIKTKEFATIADLGNNRDFDFGNGTYTDKVVAWLDKKSNNEIYRSLVHYGFVSPDTSLYQIMEKMTQYGDFLGKAILFKDLTERRGWSAEKAHLKIADEFVDYMRLPGRTRDFLERCGLMWFYNFKIRMTKIAMANVKDRPLTTLLLSMMTMTPVTDSLIGKFPVLGYTIGFDMLFKAIQSNPWIFLLGVLV